MGEVNKWSNAFILYMSYRYEKFYGNFLTRKMENVTGTTRCPLRII